MDPPDSGAPGPSSPVNSISGGELLKGFALWPVALRCPEGSSEVNRLFQKLISYKVFGFDDWLVSVAVIQLGHCTKEDANNIERNEHESASIK